MNKRIAVAVALFIAFSLGYSLASPPTPITTNTHVTTDSITTPQIIAPTSAEATYVVAATDSVNKWHANFICDGDSDQVEINEALQALPEKGGRVVLLEGTYHLSAPIYMVSNTTLTGAGAGTIITAYDIQKLIVCENIRNFTLEKIRLDAKTVYMVVISNCHDWILNELLIKDVVLGEKGVYITNSNNGKILNSNISYFGECIFIRDSNYVTISQCDIVSAKSGIKSTLIELYSNSNKYITIDKCVFKTFHSWIGTHLRGSNIVFSNNKIVGKGAYDSALIVHSDNSIVSNNYFYNVKKYAIEIRGNNVIIDKNTINLTEKHAIYVDGANNCTISYNYIDNVGNETNNAYDGIYLYNANDTRLIGNTILNSNNKMRYNIYISNSYNVTLDDNILMDSGLSGKIYFENYSVIFGNNRGFVTESHGYATITDGNTYVTVNHRLDVTPTADMISVTPVTSLGSASCFWVPINYVNATSFRIYIDQPAGVDVTFAYQIDVNYISGGD